VERLAHSELGSRASASVAGDGIPPNAELAVAEGSAQPEPHLAGGGCCALHPAQGGAESTESAESSGIPKHALLNALGGLFLVVGHSRNFLLCRKTACLH